MVRDAGGFVIADEVQAGFARSGNWWGYDTSGFTPDIVCMGKPMGNGLPVSGMAASHDMITSFRGKQRYFNTFAASPLQAAAGMAVIDEITDRDLVASVASVGRRPQDFAARTAGEPCSRWAMCEVMASSSVSTGSCPARTNPTWMVLRPWSKHSRHAACCSEKQANMAMCSRSGHRWSSNRTMPTCFSMRSVRQ